MKGVHSLVLQARYAERRNIFPGVSLERGESRRRLCCRTLCNLVPAVLPKRPIRSKRSQRATLLGWKAGSCAGCLVPVVTDSPGTRYKVGGWWGHRVEEHSTAESEEVHGPGRYGWHS